MPGFDKTGPYGEGAMTGRKMGKCTGNDVSYSEFRGRGKGRGNGRGFGRGYSQNEGIFSNVSEKTMIENEMNALKDRLNSLENRLGELNIDD